LRKNAWCFCMRYNNCNDFWIGLLANKCSLVRCVLSCIAFVLLVWQNFNKLLKNYNAKLMSYRLEDSNEIFEGTDSVFDNQSIKHFLKILQNVGFTGNWPMQNSYCM
jgi:hypothetical protein